MEEDEWGRGEEETSSQFGMFAFFAWDAYNLKASRRAGVRARRPNIKEEKKKGKLERKRRKITNKE